MTANTLTGLIVDAQVAADRVLREQERPRVGLDAEEAEEVEDAAHGSLVARASSSASSAA